MAETRTDSSSPIDILPDSLLSDIFVLTCCYQNNPLMWTHTGDGRRLDCCYVLSWVSHRWRAIALSTSRVWCFVVAPRQTEYLAAQLARSGDAPIDVLFDLIYLSKSDILKDIQESLNLLAEKSHWTRIRDLDVELSEDFPNLSDLVVEGISKVVDASPLVNFRDISVRFTDNPGDDNLEVPELDDALPGLYLPYSPVLHSVCLDLINLSLKNGVSTLPFLYLQKLEFTRMIINLSNLLLPLIALAPNLTELQLSTCWFCLEQGHRAEPRSIALPKLDSLRLYRVKGLSVLNTVFQMCEIPSLRQLVFVSESSFSFTDQDWDVDWRSLCRYNTLEEVHIGGFSSEFLTGLLLQTERLSKLREFSLGPDNVRSPTEFVEQLAQKLVDTPCCPTLHSLTIQISPNARGAELMDELRLKRPLLDIYVEP